MADVDLENVIGALERLRDLPAGYETRDLPTPAEETFGLSQRDRLVSASRPLTGKRWSACSARACCSSWNETIEANMSDPHGALRAAEDLSDAWRQSAERSDDELVVSWMRQDWEQNRYPGPQNRDGARSSEKHLRAMLALDDAHEPTFELNRQLVESAQRSLGRMTRGRSRLCAGPVGGLRGRPRRFFAWRDRAGPEAQLVFETVDGSDLSTLTVPGLYTHAGFNDFYLAQLAGIAQTLVDDQWVIGAGGEQGGSTRIC